MKIIDGLELPAERNGMVQIPDCQRNELPQFFVDMGYKKGVEIGTYRGNYAVRFAEVGLEIHTVDPFLFHQDYHPHRIKNQQRQEQIYHLAKEKLDRFPNAHIIRKTSMEALDDFEDESIDFVYIDGHHGLKYVIEDIYGWSRKVRKGGIISGHDYALRRSESLPNRPLTMQSKIAVNAYVKAFDIKKWYVLGRFEKIKGEIREDYRSWMWIK